jgi:capsular polysaccharide biosynthesis protein
MHEAAYLARGEQRTPAGGVHVLHGGSFWAWGAGASYFSAEGALLGELSPHPLMPPGGHPALRHFEIYPMQTLPGVTAALWTRWATNSWGHWLLEIAVRLRLLADCGWTPDRVDHYALPYTGQPYQNTLLEELGIPLTKILRLSPRDRLRCTTLLAPTPCMLQLGYPAWAARTLATFPARAPATPVRRLHLKRRGVAQRHVVGEEKLAEALATRGFVSLAPESLSLIEQRGLFAAADCVVGVGGSALMHLAWCRPGTRVLVIHHPRYLHHIYGELATHAGLICRRIATADTPASEEQLREPSKLPVCADPDATLAAVDALLNLSS